MTAPRFVHLRLHTEYSIVDGTARGDGAVAAAAADGMPALAITDAGNLFGAVRFYLAARAGGVQPVIGCDLAITNERNRDQPFRIVALCRDADGYLALCDLIMRAYATNQWRGRAELRREWLSGVRGLIVLSGAEAGDVGAALLAGGTAQAEELARGWARDFPGAFYVELQRADPERSAPYVRAAVALAGARAAGGRHAPGAVRPARRGHRARGARVHRAGLGARGPAPTARLPPFAVLQVPGRDGPALRGHPGGAGELGADRAPLEKQSR